MRRHPPLAAALIALIAAAPLAAAPARKTPAAPSGNVTRAQMQAQVKGIFDRADADKDGFMSKAEFGARMGAVLNRTPPGTPGAPSKAQAQEMLTAADTAFKAVDTDDDGRLSRTEASKRPLAAFDMMDADHDGILTVAEKVAARKPGAGAVPAKKLDPGR